nr:transglycosylase domain-containing protein [uncultured Chitinophaga sp.]
MRSNDTKTGLSATRPTSTVTNALKEKILRKIQSRYRLNVDFGAIRIAGINSVTIKSVRASNNAGNMLFEAGSVRVKFSWSSLLKGRVKPIAIKIADSKILVDKKERTPAPAPPTATVKTEAAAVSPQDMIRGFYKRIFGKINTALGSVPQKIDINNLEIVLSSPKNIQVNMETLAFNHTGGQLQVNVNSFTMAARSQATAPSVTITTPQIAFSLHRNKGDYDLDTSTRGLTVHNSKVSNQHPFTCDLGLVLHTKMTPDGFYIDRQSSFHLNNLRLPFYMDHLYREHDIIELGVSLIPCQMEDILTSFQDFTTQSLYRTSFSGTLGFLSRLRFELTSSFKRDFEIRLDNNLRVLNDGGTDYAYLKQPFVHTVYEEGVAVKSIHLGEDNPLFLPLDQISADLKKVIIATEDPHFYTHKGIDPEAIFLAMASNIKTRRLSRGASTITMQLVRNLFLYHSKNFQRKIEEVILTWYLEEVYAIGKDRLLEIYLNIIELGPGVYGVQEAAHFYFDKPANQLTLTESLALAYIIPRPKFFLEALKMNSPQLVRNLTAHLQHHSRVMLKKEIITPEEFENIQYKITFAPGLGALDLAEAETVAAGS